MSGMEKTRACGNCRKSARIGEMRYDRAGKELICAECLAKENRKVKTEAAAATAAVNKMSEFSISRLNSVQTYERLVSMYD